MQFILDAGRPDAWISKESCLLDAAKHFLASSKDCYKTQAQAIPWFRSSLKLHLYGLALSIRWRFEFKNCAVLTLSAVTFRDPSEIVFMRDNETALFESRLLCQGLHADSLNQLQALGIRKLGNMRGER